MAIRSYGTMAVDWEQRTDFDRLRRERLARATEHLERSELGALLCFDMANIRYITATHIGTWAMDKLIRFCLLTRDGEPIIWDFGSAAAITRSTVRGSVRSDRALVSRRCAAPFGQGTRRDVARKIRVELELRGLLNEPARSRRVERRCSLRCSRRHHRRGRSAADAGHPDDQDGGRDHAAEHGLRDGRLRLQRTLSRDEAWLSRERVRRARQQGALRARLGARRGRQRDLRRALLARIRTCSRIACCDRASPRTSTSSTRTTAIARVTTAPSRSAPSLPQADRRICALPRHPRQRDLDDQTGHHDCRGGRDLPEGAGVRLSRRGGRLRTPVRPRHRALDLGEAGLLASRLVRLPRDDSGEHGVRPRDVSGRRQTAGRRRGSRSSSSSRRTAAR